MTSDQEAVCGTCGGKGEIRYRAPHRVGELVYTCRDCKGIGHIPAPVVPSDDECESRYRGQSCHLGRAHGGPHMNLDMGGHEWEDNTIGASAPPTPSQDAEGDRLTEAWWDYDRYRAGDRYPVERAKRRAAVESAVREPYEALEKAARAVISPPPFEGNLPDEWLDAVLQRGHPERCDGYVHMFGPERCPCGVLESVRRDYARSLAVTNLRTALTHIEESLGGRS